MFSRENDAFKFSKNCEKHKQHVHHVHHSARTSGIVFFCQTSLKMTRNMNVNVIVELYQIFSKISNLYTGNFSLTLSKYLSVVYFQCERK